MTSIELSGRETTTTLRVQRSWSSWLLWSLPRRGIGFLLAIETVTGLMSVLVTWLGIAAFSHHVHAEVLVRLGLLVVLTIVYGELTDRVEHIWVWLHSGRGAFAAQNSILLFAGLLVLPAWAAVTQCVITYAHIGILNARNDTAPAHRWVWTGTTVLLATLASAKVYEALGGTVSHIGVLQLAAILLAATVYSGVNLVVLLGGMYLAVRPPSWRAIVPDRSQLSYEAAKLLLGLVGAVLVIHSPLLVPAVLLFAAMLHRSSLVAELKTVATTDAKTGLLTYRAWTERSGALLDRCARSNQAAAVVLIDLDHFKRLNDTFGHAAGDRELAAIGEIIATEVRDQDAVGRFGGEEFVVFLPGASESRALEVADRLRVRIAEVGVASGSSVTASLGIAAHQHASGTLDELMSAADAAMYEAKRCGRNTVRVAAAAA